MISPAKSSVSWIQLSLFASPVTVEIASDYLIGLGASGLEQVDLSHPSPPDDLGQGQIELRAFFAPGTDMTSLTKDLEAFLGNARLHLAGLTFSSPRIKTIHQEDWSDGWRRFFVPTRVGRYFIHPGWEVPDPGEAFPVRIDPGLAFGTGLHPTTRLCLQEMDQILPVPSLLDLGCGSGILAIAAARSCVPRVAALDNDPTACQVAEENLERNDLAGNVLLVSGEVSEIHSRFAMVVANILSSTLIALAPGMASLLEPRGILLLSGCLQEEESEVRTAFENEGFTFAARRTEAEWMLLRFTGPERERTD
jgi:ribosomal protein L11 methyltransferase